jgi:hypothetical protein
MLDRFPEPRREPDPALEARFAIVQRFVGAVRRLRATQEKGSPNGRRHLNWPGN